MARRAVLFPLFCGLLFSSCGKKGPLLPPLVRVPQPVQQLELRQWGTQIILTWTNPTAYVDGNPLPTDPAVEIWIAKDKDSSKEAVSMVDFRGRAKLLARIEPSRQPALLKNRGREGTLSYVYIPENGVTHSRTLTFALRVEDTRKRVSDFSEPISIEVRRMPAPPRSLRATVHPDRIEVRWEASAAIAGAADAAGPVGYNVYRSEEQGPVAGLNASPVKGLEFRDSDIVFGRTYRYFVRAAASGSPPQAESEDSEVIVVEAKDVFPPAAPTGLTAVAGAGIIALSWEAGPESDLAGYRVWRKEETQEPFVLLQELAANENSYSDSGVEKNRRYVYAITALDAAGNESHKSNPASGVVRDGPA